MADVTVESLKAKIAKLDGQREVVTGQLNWLNGQRAAFAALIAELEAPAPAPPANEETAALPSA